MIAYFLSSTNTHYMNYCFSKNVLLYSDIKVSEMKG